MSDSEEEVVQAMQSGLGDMLLVAGEAPTSQADDADVCELCDEELFKSEKSKHSKFGFAHLHLCCFNALHAAERLFKKPGQAGLKAAMLRCLRMDLARFKAVVLSLVTSRKRERTAADRNAVVEFCEVLLLSLFNTLLQ